jgi:hypothetical protein
VQSLHRINGGRNVTFLAASALVYRTGNRPGSAAQIEITDTKAAEVMTAIDEVAKALVGDRKFF